MATPYFLPIDFYPMLLTPSYSVIVHGLQTARFISKIDLCKYPKYPLYQPI